MATEGHTMIRGARIPYEELAAKNQLEVMDEYPSDFNLTETLKIALGIAVENPDLNTNLADSLLLGYGLPVDDGDLSGVLTEGIVITNS